MAVSAPASGGKDHAAPAALASCRSPSGSCRFSESTALESTIAWGTARAQQRPVHAHRGLTGQIAGSYGRNLRFAGALIGADGGMGAAGAQQRPVHAHRDT